MIRLLVAAALLGAAACLPNPESVKERREHFDRDGLMGEYLLTAPPPGMREVGATFGERIKLVGYTLDPAEPKRGDSVEIRFYWSVSRPVAEDYMVFVHGDAIGGNARRIHADHYPAGGKYPTDVWREGEIVVDPFTISVPGTYGPERLGIFTGMYLGDYRVPLTDKGPGVGDNENRSRPIELVFPPAQ
ncbi:MAG: hypothetical protein IT384_24145 [Deltaproteobacteria bacterium]|nr:hypothetical protein [Deltaproteobacteria bacterium]